MVTSVPFYSFKDINFRRSVPFWAVLVIVLALILVSANPPLVLFGLFVAYSLSGYAMWRGSFRQGARRARSDRRAGALQGAARFAAIVLAMPRQAQPLTLLLLRSLLLGLLLRLAR